MNREIKYRGLTSNGNWVCGNLIQGKNGACYICSINENPVYKNGDYWYIDSPCYVVIPETVGQFTGLKDQNGEEVYEGDVLELNNCGLLIVCFYKGEFKLQKLAEYHKKRNLYASISYLEFSVLRGNIYENPELLTI